MKTSIAGPTAGTTAAQETTRAAGDANNGRDTKTDGHIGRRRDINTRRDAREVDSRKNHKTEGLTAVQGTTMTSGDANNRDERTGGSKVKRRDVNQSCDVTNSRDANHRRKSTTAGKPTSRGMPLTVGTARSV
jgi:hypothetical protein